MNIKGLGPATFVPEEAASTVRMMVGHLFTKRELMCSRNASTVRGLFHFTAVRFPINSSLLAFAHSPYKIHFH